MRCCQHDFRESGAFLGFSFSNYWFIITVRLYLYLILSCLMGNLTAGSESESEGLILLVSYVVLCVV